MTASDLRRASRPVKLALLLVLVVLAWHLSAPSPYKDNIDDIVDTSDPHGYVPFFVFLVATALFVHDWPRAELVSGLVIAGVALVREVSYEWKARHVVAAEDLTHLAQQPGMLYLLGIVAGAALAISGGYGLRYRDRRQRRSILFLGATMPRSKRRRGSAAATEAAPEWTPFREHLAVEPRPPREQVEGWIEGLGDAAPSRRRAAAAGLGELGAQASDALPALIACLRDPDPEVRSAVIEALERVASPERRAVR